MVCFSTESAALSADYFSARSLFGAFCSLLSFATRSIRLPNSILSFLRAGSFLEALGLPKTWRTSHGQVFSRIMVLVDPCESSSSGLWWAVKRCPFQDFKVRKFRCSFLSPTSVSHWFGGLIKALVIFAARVWPSWFDTPYLDIQSTWRVGVDGE